MPIPPKKGGAVENLVYNFLKKNSLNTHYSIDVFGIGDAQDELLNTKFRYYHSLLYKQYLKIPANYRNKIPFNPFLHAVCKQLKIQEYDYVIVENRFSFIPQIRQATRGKVYLHIHNSHLSPYTKLKDFALRHCDGVLAVSSFLQNEILELYPHMVDKVIVWHNGVDTKRFSANISEGIINSIRKKLGISETDFVIAYTGRIIPEKGVLELVKAFNFVNQKEKNCKLLLIGSSWYAGPRTSDKYQDDVRSEAKRNPDSIIFTGYIDNHILPQYLAVANVLVYPSIWQEPFGLTIVEGLSTGKPVISIANGGIGEIYKVCGDFTQKLLITSSREQSEIVKHLEEKILVVINDDNYKGKNLSQISAMETHFSLDAYFNKFCSII